jgi:amino acid adenylation domain-containing protein
MLTTEGPDTINQQGESRLNARNLPAPALQPVSREGHLPLSFAQQRLWFLDQLEPGSPTYLLPLAIRLSGPLHLATFQHSVQAIVQRHEVLRTTIFTVNGEPRQIIDPILRLPLPLVDLSELPVPQREALARQMALQESEQPIDLASKPLLRATLLRLSPNEHILLLTLHSIISDSWSMGIFMRELASLYQAFTQNQPSPLPSLSIQYADFASWQRQWLQGEVFDTQLAYWREQLRDLPALLRLPTHYPRPGVQRFQGERYVFQLPQPLSLAVRVLSQREGVTLFMTLLAAFQLLLARYSGQDDIVVGTPISNRTRTEIEPLIGCFVNTLVLRTRLSGEPTVRELLQRVREMVLGAYAHQDLPFEQIVEALQPKRDPSRNPLFQVMFELQHAPQLALDLTNLTLEPLEIEIHTARFDLTLTMEESEAGLVGTLEYSIDLFEARTIAQMVTHLQRLLEGMVADPEQSIWLLPFVSVAERHQLLVEWSHTTGAYLHDKCIHELFEQQVKRTPDAIAVVFEDEQLTYSELNARANQLARHLEKVGAGPEVLVGICLDRSVGMIVGLLGILKAGSAYVPLDPTYPKERFAFLLEDSQIAILLTQQRLAHALPTHTARSVYLDSDWHLIAQESKANSASGVQPAHLAYVIYTSGSTGQPKGVLIPHHALTNYVEYARDRFGLLPDDHVLQFASISFDASAEEIYPCLISGATLFLRTDIMLNSVATFLQQCQAWSITTLNLPTAYWHELIRSLETDAVSFPPTICKVIIGGERALPELLTIWQKNVDQRVRLFNTYGPTETTIAVTTAELHGNIQQAKQQREVLIGGPIPNVSIYLLDAHFQQVPVGVAGELYIAGICLARGYLRRPELTAERFLPDPFSNDPAARLYKTGDLARYLPDGQLEYLGRTDTQVKIRGYRIELGEIEAVLARHPGVSEAVVIARTPGTEQRREEVFGDKQLVAYVVARQQHEAPTQVDLRRFLAKQLPVYMLPSAFVLLETLPLTPNGKVDHHALPIPENSRSLKDNDYVAPRTPVEKLVAGIWGEVLKLEQVGIHDNFFELGGHSLLATQIAFRVSDTLQLNVSLRTVFEFPTVAELAEAIETLHRIDDKPRLDEQARLLDEQDQLREKKIRQRTLSLIRNMILVVIVGWGITASGLGTDAVNGLSTLSAFEDFGVIMAVIVIVFISLKIWILVRVRAQLKHMLKRIESLEEHGVVLANEAFRGLEEDEDAPDFELPDIFTGKTYTLKDLLSDKESIDDRNVSTRKGLILIFSSASCGPCNAVIPDYMELVKRFGNETTFAMITDGTPEGNRLKFAQYDEKPLVLLQKGKTISNAYKVRVTSAPIAVGIRFDGSIYNQPAEGMVAIKLHVLEATMGWCNWRPADWHPTK